MLNMLGRDGEALTDLRRAVRLFGGSGDQLWQARALNIRGLTARSGWGTCPARSGTSGALPRSSSRWITRSTPP